MTSEVIVTIFELIVTISFGMIIAFIICWQAAIMCIICSPIMIFGMYMTATMVHGTKGGRSKEAKEDEVDDFEKSNALLADIVINYRTIISFGQKNVD